MRVRKTALSIAEDKAISSLIKMENYIEAHPEDAFYANIVKMGTGACITTPKRFLGKKALVIVMREGITTLDNKVSIKKG